MIEKKRRYKRRFEYISLSKGRMDPSTEWEIFGKKLCLVFEEIIKDDELLEKFYCPLRQRVTKTSFDENLLKEIVTEIPGIIYSLSDENPVKFLNSYLPIAKTKSLFMIVGDVGTGKSTFVNHFFKIEVKKLGLQDRIEGIIINLLDRYPRSEDTHAIHIRHMEVYEWFMDQIDKYLTVSYNEFEEPIKELLEKIFEKKVKIYNWHYKDLSESDGEKAKDCKSADLRNWQEDLRLYNIARIRYIKEKYKKNIFIIIDNIDHYNPEFQKEVCLMCREMMVDFDCSFILTTREYTLPIVFKHIELSAIQFRFQHLPLPVTKELIKKRCDYILDYRDLKSLIGFQGDEILIPLLENKLNFDEFKKRMRIILDSLLTSEIIDMLENLSNYNYRSILSNIRIALSSGCLYPEERQERYSSVRDYDFLKALMCGNNQNFHPKNESNVVINLFDNDEPDFEGNNLIRFRILQSIESFHRDKGVFIDEIVEFMKSLGYKEDSIKKVLDDFAKCDLIESTYFGSYIIRDYRPEKFVLTKSGVYYLKNLPYMIAYLENVKDATYMYEEYIQSIEGLIEKSKYKPKKERIEARLDATKVFLEYLKEKEREEANIVEKFCDENGKNNYSKIDSLSSYLEKSYIESREKILGSID